MREAVQAGLVALAAAAVLAFHGRRLGELVADPEFEASLAKRPYVVYLYAVCFVSVLAALASGAVAAYGLVRVVAPSLVSTGPASLERDEGVVALAANGFIAVAAFCHLRPSLEAHQALRRYRASRDAAGPRRDE